jgi:hypothetical protein
LTPYGGDKRLFAAIYHYGAPPKGQPFYLPDLPQSMECLPENKNRGICNMQTPRTNLLCNQNGFRQLIINGIPPILNGNGTAAPAARYDRDGFSTIATQRKQERIQFFILSFDRFDPIFLSRQRVLQIHGASSLHFKLATAYLHSLPSLTPFVKVFSHFSL